MQEIFEFDQSVQEYYKSEEWVNNPMPSCCCFCENHSPKCLRFLGSYTRHILEDREWYEIRINRWICKIKSRTISMLPSCIQPYLKLPTKTLMIFIELEDPAQAEDGDFGRSKDFLICLLKRLDIHNNRLYGVLKGLACIETPQNLWKPLTLILKLLTQHFRGLGNALLEMVSAYRIAPFGYYKCHQLWANFVRKKGSHATGV